jgi:hypothetical protein
VINGNAEIFSVRTGNHCTHILCRQIDLTVDLRHLR